MGYDPGLRCMGLDISFVYGLEYSLKKSPSWLFIKKKSSSCLRLNFMIQSIEDFEHAKFNTIKRMMHLNFISSS